MFRSPLSHTAGESDGNPFAKRLYDDLLSNYNRLIRPVGNNTEKLTVWLKLKLSQLIDVVRSAARSVEISSECIMQAAKEIMQDYI